MVELQLSVEKEFLTVILDLQGNKPIKIKYEYNIFALVGPPRINQEEVEALKGILRLAQKLLLEANRIAS